MHIMLKGLWSRSAPSTKPQDFISRDMSRRDVLNALQALHHHPDGAVKRQAGLWLEHWQQSVEAWSISDGILHDPNSSLEAQYFSSQTLRTKVPPWPSEGLVTRLCLDCFITSRRIKAT